MVEDIESRVDINNIFFMLECLFKWDTCLTQSAYGINDLTSWVAMYLQ